MSDAVCFAVYGTALSPDEARKRLGCPDGESLWDAYYAAVKRFEDTEDVARYEIHETNDGTSVYMGVAPDSMAGNETRDHYQTRVERVLLKVLGQKLKFGYHVEAY